MGITAYLKAMVTKNASDLFFSVGTPVHIKIAGNINALNDKTLNAEQVKEVAYSLMNGEQMKSFEKDLELNLALSLKGIGRFRVNVFHQRGEIALVIRYIKSDIPSIMDLNLPPLLQELALEREGLILVVGTTGCGKSSTLASMIDYRNQTMNGHILTIEDPIEYLHQHKKSIVDQREVGIDTLSYANALKNALREAPDVILIGEIRDQETMQQAIAYAQTGHLCLSTLHASNANQALERIVNFFPKSAREQLLSDLAFNTRAIISQRLIPCGERQSVVPAIEILLNNPHITDLIEKGDITGIKEAMERNGDSDMQTFDQALFALYQSKKISEDDALRYADSRNNLSLNIRLAENGVLENKEELRLRSNQEKTSRHAD